MRVLLTGAGGFLGGAISRRLSARSDIDLVAAARTALRDPATVQMALAVCRPDVVVHAAGRTQGGPHELHADNVVATATLAQAVAARGCGLILLSSAAQYGASANRRPWTEADPCAPLGAYGQSKLAAETAALGTVEKAVALRLFNVVSSVPHGGQAYASFLRRAAVALQAPPPRLVPMGPLGAVRDFVTVDDVVSAVERAVDRAAWGGAINVCTGVGRTVRSLVEDTIERIDRALILDATGETEGIDWSVGDPSLCQARLGFTPSSDLTTLVAQAATWVRMAGGEDPNA